MIPWSSAGRVNLVICSTGFNKCGAFIGSTSILAPAASIKFTEVKFFTGVHCARGHGTRFAVVQGHRRGPIIGSLKSPCRTSYWSSIKITALYCLVFEKTVFVYAFQETDGQTNRQTNRLTASSRPRFCKWRFNNNNNNPIYKAPMALASEALAAGQSWVLIKSLTEEVRTF